LLETEATLEIRHLISDLKPGDGDLLAALHRVQERFGYVPKEAIGVVARQLRLTEARVFGALTFYSEFRLTPPPEITVSWCGGPACWIRGGRRVREAFEAVLGIRLGENTPDNRIGLHLGQCNGTCHFAPMVWVNGRVRGPLTVAEAVRLARELKGDGGAS
jgi:NADH:ubiquinone oxidoreductase subunit E